MHHYVSSSKFILGNGAELRGSFTRKPLPEPYSLVVDTEDLKEDLIRRGPTQCTSVSSSWSCSGCCKETVESVTLSAENTCLLTKQIVSMPTILTLCLVFFLWMCQLSSAEAPSIQHFRGITEGGKAAQTWQLQIDQDVVNRRAADRKDGWLCRYTNIQLINTIGVKEADKRECLECWCKVRCGMLSPALRSLALLAHIYSCQKASERLSHVSSAKLQHSGHIWPYI